MKTELRFNICGLETSCVLNREIFDLAARVIGQERYICTSILCMPFLGDLPARYDV